MLQEGVIQQVIFRYFFEELVIWQIRIKGNLFVFGKWKRQRKEGGEKDRKKEEIGREKEGKKLIKDMWERKRKRKQGKRKRRGRNRERKYMYIYVYYFRYVGIYK